MKDWVSWSEKPPEAEKEAWAVSRLEAWVVSKLAEVISRRFGVDCIVIEGPTEEEIEGAVVVTQIPVPRFVKLFEKPLVKLGPNWTLEALEEYSREQGYGLERVIRALREKLSGYER